MTTLAHLSLASGYLSHVARDMIDDITKARARAVLTKALDTGPVQLTGDLAGCSLTIARAGAAIEASVHWLTDAGQNVPLLLFGVAARAREGHGVWERLLSMQATLPAAVPVQEPPAPWLATLPLPMVMYLGIDLPDIDDALMRFQEALAWAWLETTTEEAPPGKPGRPSLGDAAKRKVTIRMSPDVLAALRAQNRPYDDVIREALVAVGVLPIVSD